MLDKVLLWLNEVELSRVRRLSSYFRDLVDRESVWETRAATVGLPAGACRTLSTFFSLRAKTTRFASGGTEVALQNVTQRVLLQSTRPLLPSHLSPATCYFEFEASGPGLVCLSGKVGVATRGSSDVRGVPIGGEHFFSDKTSHPSDSSPLAKGGIRGIGLEWPTRQIFIVEAGELLFFESVADIFPHPAVELYASVLLELPAQTTAVSAAASSVKFAFNFGAQRFLFDLNANLAARGPEIEQELRLKQKYALPIIRCSLCNMHVPISEDGIVEPHNCTAPAPPTPKKDDAACLLM